jgi:hypothetical protein
LLAAARTPPQRSSVQERKDPYDRQGWGVAARSWRVSSVFVGNWSFFAVVLGFTGPSLGLSLGWSIAAAGTPARY